MSPRNKRSSDGTPAGEELVTIATFPNALEASVARGALEAEGVTAFVSGENFGTFARTRTYPDGTWPELKVHRRDRERAMEALKKAGRR